MGSLRVKTVRRALKLFGFLAAIVVLGILGLSGWLVIFRRDALENGSAYAAKTVCSNVFMANRDVDSILRTDLLALGHPIFHLMKIDVSAADHRVDAGYFGLFAERHAEFIEGRGCTNVISDASWDRPARCAPCLRTTLVRFGPLARRYSYLTTLGCKRR